MSELRHQDPVIFDAIEGERRRETETLELIASLYCLLAMRQRIARR